MWSGSTDNIYLNRKINGLPLMRANRMVSNYFIRSTQGLIV